MILTRRAFFAAAATAALARPEDMATDGDILKPPAPPPSKYVLDKGLGGLAS